MLQQLPVELQLIIAKQLERRDWPSLSLTSHHFYDLTTPLLYEVLDDNVSDFLRLVDTLGRNPSLRKFPRSLRVEAWDPTPLTEWEDEHSRAPIDAEEEDPNFWAYRVGLLCRLAKAACPSGEEGDAWARDIRVEDNDAWLALLLTLTPGLTRFEVQFPESGRWVQRVIEWAVSGQLAERSALQSVQEVYVSARWFEFQDETERVTQWTLMFLGLPALRRIATDGLSGDEDNNAIKSTSSVTRISIALCKGVQHLDKLIANCPKLESYRHQYVPMASSKRHNLDPREFYPALLHARHTLKELWLDIFPKYVIENEDGVHWPSFDDFAILELLHVPIFLLGEYRDTPVDLAPMLPSSLKTLHVTEVEKSTLSPLLKSLLRYITTASSDFGELLVANMGAIASRDAIMAAVETDTRMPDLTPAERAAPAIKYVANLSKVCGQRNIRFGIHGTRRKGLESWKAFDPFEETR